jgi:hypothetical protein
MSDTIQFNIVVGGVPQTVKSIADIDRHIKAMQDTIKTTEIHSKRLATGLELVGAQKVKTQMMGVSSAMGGMANQTSQAGVAMQNMNFVIRDSPFFFKDLQLGVLAVGNNINPLIDSFQRLKIQAAEMNKTTKESITAFSLLRKSMAGPMGLSIAMSLLVTAFQAVIFSMASANRKSKEQQEELKKEREQVSKLRAEYKGLVKDRELATKDDTSLETLANLQRQRDAVKEIVEEKKKELERIKQIDDKLGIVTITQKELTEYIAIEERELKRLNLEVDFILFAWQKVNDELDKSVKKTKTGLDYLRDFAREMEAIRAVGFGRETGVTPAKEKDKFLGIPFATPDFLEGAEGFRKKVKETAIDTRLLGAVANQTGTLIAQAFMQGTFAIDRMLQSLLATIAQMYILKLITGTLGFATGGSVGAAVAAVATPSLNKGGPQVIQIEGTSTINSRQFITEFRRAETQIVNRRR